MSSDVSPRGRETVTAFFESRADAEAALARLQTAGLPVEEARIHEGRSDAAPEADPTARHKGFWEMLGDLFLPQEDRGAYAEGLSRGGTLLSVPVRSKDRTRVIDILDDEGTVDFDARRESWRSEGWGGPATSPLFGDPGNPTSSLGDGATAGPLGGDAGHSPRSEDAGLRSGISGIGAHAAGAPPATLSSRDESLARNRVRYYRWDGPTGESTVEIEDGRERDEPGADRRTDRFAG